MRQVVNGAKGGPLLGHSSCMSILSDEESDHDRNQRSPKSKGPRQQIERERRLRREIANSNERRRMQSINQGYMSLKAMLPLGDGSEKLSKAAVLQNAAEYMAQLLEERKQLLIRNAELTQALSSQRHIEGDSLITHKRRKRDVTESSDEGISMSYQPPNSHESELLDELKRTVTELRIQLQKESQRRAILEQSYSAYYSSLVAAQTAAAAVQQHPPSGSSDTDVLAAQLSPPQSRHPSTDQVNGTAVSYHADYQHDQQPSPPAVRQQYLNSHQKTAASAPQQQQQQMFGKASSVASQNLSIIVEAINHLEGDKHVLNNVATDKEADSGISMGEPSDDNKSEGSGSDTPQPPPAHQSSTSLNPHISSVGSPLNYNSSTALQTELSGSSAVQVATPASVPLVYRPTFLSSYMSSQAQQSSLSNGYLSLSHRPQRHHSL